MSSDPEPEIEPLRLHWFLFPDVVLDFHIHVGGEEIAASREVLAGRSHYFRTMFSSGMQEAHSASMDAIGMHSAALVRSVLDYMHGHPVSIAWQDIGKLVDIVEYWQVHQLRDRVQCYLGENIVPANLEDLLSLGEQYNMQGVVDSVHDYMSEHFVRLLGRVRYLHMELNDLQRALPSCVVRNVSAQHKLQGCVKWLQHRDARARHAAHLAAHLQLGFGANFLKLLGSFCKRAIDKLQVYVSLDGTSKLGIVNEGCTMLALGAEDLVEPKVKNLLKFDFTTEKMDTVGTVPSLFEEPMACCWTPYGIFAVNVKNKCGVLDIHSLNYLRVADLPVPLYSMRAVFRQGKVYVLGQEGVLARLYSINIGGQRQCPWIQLTLTCDPLFGAISPLGMVDCVVFWLSEGRQLKRMGMAAYGVTTCQLTLAHPWNACMAVVSASLYILGHTGGGAAAATGSNCRYNTVSGEHSAVAPSLLPRPGQCHAVYLPALRRIALAGGFRNEIELYNLDSDTWTLSQLHMPFKTSLFTMAM